LNAKKIENDQDKIEIVNLESVKRYELKAKEDVNRRI
jgi:hypothetical protein